MKTKKNLIFLSAHYFKIISYTMQWVVIYFVCFCLLSNNFTFKLTKIKKLGDHIYIYKCIYLWFLVKIKSIVLDKLNRSWILVQLYKRLAIPNKRHATELSNYIWNLKDNKTDLKIKWEILNWTKSKFNTKYSCKLCNLEKIEIDKSDKNITLNKKSERQNICIHYQKRIKSKIKKSKTKPLTRTIKTFGIY